MLQEYCTWPQLIPFFTLHNTKPLLFERRWKFLSKSQWTYFNCNEFIIAQPVQVHQMLKQLFCLM